MFNYISGRVAELLPSCVVIDCSGVGFQLNASSYTLGQLKTDEFAKLYTYVHIREDIFEIYGFANRSEKQCFEMLIGVSGVGPKAALSILSVNTPESLITAIISENEKAITAAAGVGKKIAQRVILELRDKITKDNILLTMSNPSSISSVLQANTKMNDASAALSVLGYSASEVNTVLKQIDTETLSLEEIIKCALKLMMK